MQDVFAWVLHVHRPKSPRSDVQGHPCDVNGARHRRPQQLGRKMKPGRGRRDTSDGIGIHRLVPLPVLRVRRALDVRRERNLPETFDQLEWIALTFEVDYSPPVGGSSPRSGPGARRTRPPVGQA